MKKIIIFILAFLFFFCGCNEAIAKNFSAGLTLGSWTGWMKGEIKVGLGGMVTSTPSPSLSYYPKEDSRGKWVAKNIMQLEKSIGFSVNKEKVFFLLPDQTFIEKDLEGRKISFPRKKYEIGSVTIMEYFDTSEKVTDPILDWEVERDNIYVLTTSQISFINAQSGEIERVISCPEKGITSIAVENDRIYFSTANQIFCYNFFGEKLWSWTSFVPANFKELEVRNGILYTISDNQLFRIKVGNIRKKEVRQSAVVSSSKNQWKIIDLALDESRVIALDKNGVIKIYNSDLDEICSFVAEGARAIAMEGNRLYVFINNEISIFEIN
ncbi:MAG: hypothetical protein ABH808_00075 [Candidatus Kuenenbacteria bacterium]